MRVIEEPGLSLYADTARGRVSVGHEGKGDVHGALLSFKTAPPCTNLNCVFGREVRSSSVVFNCPSVVDGSGNGMTILSLNQRTFRSSFPSINPASDKDS
jgi:hypothetical protein